MLDKPSSTYKSDKSDGKKKSEVKPWQMFASANSQSGSYMMSPSQFTNIFLNYLFPTDILAQNLARDSNTITSAAMSAFRASHKEWRK